jgi:hypothetical protein
LAEKEKKIEETKAYVHDLVTQVLLPEKTTGRKGNYP